MTTTPETDNLARGNHVVSTGFAQDLERQLISARTMVNKLRRERAVARQFGEQMERKCDQYRSALQRLADCDWTISLPDRMDAVRKIAREALQ